jgi:hypothetical protein
MGHTEFHLGVAPRFEHEVVRRLKLRAHAQAWFSTLSRPDFGPSGGSGGAVDLGLAAVYGTERYSLTGGFRLGTVGGPDTSAFKLYPVVEARASLVPRKAVFEAQLGGGMTYNRRYDLLVENPWLSSNSRLLPTVENWRAGGYLFGALNRFGYRLGATYRSVGLMPLVVAGPIEARPETHNLLPGQLILLAESGFTQLTVTAQASYETIKGVRFGAKLDYSVYGLQDLEQPWHLPAFTAETWAQYTLLKKLTLRAGLHLIGSRPIGFDSNEEVITAALFPDLNLNATYSITKTFGLFVEMNNLLNQRYERWGGYLERPLDIKVGGTINF